jgi:uncharacterized membrane protein YbhN (UPF0104 family)
MKSTLRISLLVTATAAAVVLFVVVARPGRLLGSLAALPLSAVLAAVAATMAGVMLGAVRWRSLLAAAGVHASPSRLFAALTIGAAVNNLVPARGGDAVRVESAHQLTGASRLTVGGTMVSERILDAFVLGLLVVAGAVGAGAGSTYAWIGLAVAVGVAAAAALLGRRHLTAFRTVRVAVPALGVTIGIWFADVVMYGALAHGFDLHVSPATLLLLVGAGNLALAIPGTAAGLGSFELVTLAGAHGIGVGGPELAAFVLAVHAVIVLPPTLTGLALARVALPKVFLGRRDRVVAHR